MGCVVGGWFWLFGWVSFVMDCLCCGCFMFGCYWFDCVGLVNVWFVMVAVLTILCKFGALLVCLCWFGYCCILWGFGFGVFVVVCCCWLIVYIGEIFRFGVFCADL